MADDLSGSKLGSVGRLWSIDALRGFDMFWIIGGDALVRQLAKRVNTPAADAFAQQFEHVAWEGFRFYDLIFPLFLFLVGAVLPFSLGKLRADGGAAYRRIARRTVVLFMLGIMGRSFFAFDWSSVRVAGVLQRIALCYGIAAVIYLNSTWRTQIAAVIVILAGYWLLMTNVAAPGGTAGDLSPSGNLAGWVDRHVLPGKILKEYYGFGDNEGILSTIPAVATALLGVLAGQLLKSTLAAWRKIAILVVAGALGAAAGLAWGQFFPIIKNLWTSSFVLLAGGYSAWLLALAYLLVDVAGFRKSAYFFVVIGANAITIYWMRRFVEFDKIASYFLSGAIQASGSYGPIVATLGVIAAEWLLLHIMYRNKIFLRV
jgi:predicted acyltransferase